MYILFQLANDMKIAVYLLSSKKAVSCMTAVFSIFNIHSIDTYSWEIYQITKTEPILSIPGDSRTLWGESKQIQPYI